MKFSSWELATDTARDTVKWVRTVPVQLEKGTREFDAFLINQSFRGEQDTSFSIQFNLSGADAGFVCESVDPKKRWVYNGGSYSQWENWVVTDCLRRCDFARQFFFDEGEGLRREGLDAEEKLLVWNNGSAAWRWHSHSSVLAGARFCWCAPESAEEFLFRPALDVWAQIQHQLSNERGEAAFARAFARQSELERASTVNSWRGGTRTEMEDVLETLFMAYGEYADTEIGHFYLGSANDLRWKYRRRDFPHEIPDALKKDIEQVWRHFEPFDPRIEEFECVLDWIDRRNLQVEVRLPSLTPLTAHERLEAMLRWRQWQEQHFS